MQDACDSDSYHPAPRIPTVNVELATNFSDSASRILCTPSYGGDDMEEESIGSFREISRQTQRDTLRQLCDSSVLSMNVVQEFRKYNSRNLSAEDQRERVETSVTPPPIVHPLAYAEMSTTDDGSHGSSPATQNQYYKRKNSTPKESTRYPLAYTEIRKKSDNCPSTLTLLRPLNSGDSESDYDTVSPGPDLNTPKPYQNKNNLHMAPSGISGLGPPKNDDVLLEDEIKRTPWSEARKIGTISSKDMLSLSHRLVELEAMEYVKNGPQFLEPLGGIIDSDNVAWAKETLTDESIDIFQKKFAVSLSQLHRLTEIYNGAKSQKNIRGLFKKDIMSAMCLDDFFADRLMSIFGNEYNTISLTKFIWICIILSPSKTEKLLIHKAELFGRVIGRQKSLTKSIPDRAIEEFLYHSCQRMKVQFGKEIRRKGVEKLKNALLRYVTEVNDVDFAQGHSASQLSRLSTLRGAINDTIRSIWSNPLSGKLGDNEVTTLEIILFLVSHPDLIRDLNMKSVNVEDTAEYDVMLELDLEFFLEMVAFETGFSQAEATKWNEQLRKQGAWTPKHIQKLSKTDWRALDLPILVYHTIAEKLRMKVTDVVYVESETEQEDGITWGNRCKRCCDVKSIALKFWFLGCVAFATYSITPDMIDVFGWWIVGARAAAGVVIGCVFFIFWLVSYRHISWFSRLLARADHSYNRIIQNVESHMICGFGVLIFSLLHTGSWCGAIYHMDHNSGEIIESWKRLKTNINSHWVTPPSQLDFHLSWPGITGWIMVVCIILMAFTGRDSQRKKRFNLFITVHHLYIVFIGSFFIHGYMCFATDIPKSPFIIAPGFLIFFFDKFYSCCFKCKSRELHVIKDLHTDTAQLNIPYPRDNIRWHLGQWAWLRIPSISLWEWHPFTISNANEKQLSFQIQASGDWTNKLVQLADEDPEVLSTAYVQGPVGTLGAKFGAFRHMVLIGSGVGVTPYASVLDWVTNQLENAKEMHIEKLTFIWILREQSALEWFGDIVSKLQHNWDAFQVQIYLTSRRRDDVSALGYRMMAIATKSKHGSTFSSNPTQFFMGRPDFDVIFSEIKRRHVYPDEKVGVFFCGNKRLCDAIETASSRHSEVNKCQFRFFPEFFT